jgi:hypothetical protein
MKNCTPILSPGQQPAGKNFSAEKSKKILSGFQKRSFPFFFLFLFIASSLNLSAQLGVYSFTGTGACPNQNPAVTTQPSNATFSNFTNVGETCDPLDNAFQYKDLNTGTSIDLTKYHQFTITPGAGYALTLTSLLFTHSSNDAGSITWALRSSIDNYAANISTGTVTTSAQTPTVTLPAASFTNTGAITFRIYIINANSNGTRWTIDDVTLNGTTMLNAWSYHYSNGYPACRANMVLANQCSGYQYC